MSPLSWRTENGKQPAVIISGDPVVAIGELEYCFKQNHKVLDLGRYKPNLQILNGSVGDRHGFLLDYAGDDTMTVVAHWNSALMTPEAFLNVENRMEKIAIELHEARERQQPFPAPEGVYDPKAWARIGPGQIVEVEPEDDVELVVPDFSPMGPHETPGFRTELRQLLNKHSKDTETGMPDFVLAQLMGGQLESLAEALKTSDEWKKS